MLSDATASRTLSGLRPEAMEDMREESAGLPNKPQKVPTACRKKGSSIAKLRFFLN